MGLSFGNLGSTSFGSLASSNGLAMGDAAENSQRNTFTLNSGENLSLGSSVLKSPTASATQKPKLTFGSSVPKYTPVFASKNTPLTYGASVPKTTSSNRFDTGSGLSSFLNTFSLGKREQPKTAAQYYGTSAPLPSTLASLPTSIVPSTMAQSNTVKLDPLAGMGDLLADVAGGMFSDFLGGQNQAQVTPVAVQPAAPSFLQSLTPVQIGLGAVALGGVLYLAMGGGKPRRRSGARR